MEPNDHDPIRDAHGLTPTHYTIFSYLTIEPPRPAERAVRNAVSWVACV